MEDADLRRAIELSLQSLGDETKRQEERIALEKIVAERAKVREKKDIPNFRDIITRCYDNAMAKMDPQQFRAELVKFFKEEKVRRFDEEILNLLAYTAARAVFDEIPSMSPKPVIEALRKDKRMEEASRLEQACKEQQNRSKCLSTMDAVTLFNSKYFPSENHLLSRRIKEALLNHVYDLPLTEQRRIFAKIRTWQPQTAHCFNDEKKRDDILVMLQAMKRQGKKQGTHAPPELRNLILEYLPSLHRPTFER
jgi:hypothetical protein